ncbi:MAG: DUF1573 domain-containing protein [Deltaproteobacteria bacterium]|nr:DUF1573 domain-containing protein [Deltaproteobacteria bacterium]
MKSLLSNAILALAGVGLWVLPLAAQDAAAPKAVVSETILDLGIVPKGDQAKFEFVVRNEGTAELEITEVRPACGCTVAQFESRIPPGGSGKITAVLDTTNLYGANSKTLTVFTNDPANATMVLTVKSDVKPYLAASPGYARFNTVQLEHEGTITQNLWAEDGNDFKVVSAEAPYPFMRTSFREATEEEKIEKGKGRQWLVDITLASDAPVGALTKHLVITTDHPKQKWVKIPVSGFVRPVVAVTPPQVNFRSVDLNEPKSTHLLFKNFATELVHVTGVESNMENLTATVVPVEEGRSYRVSLEMGPTSKKGPFSGKLTIATDSKKVPSVEVEISGAVI